MIKVTNVLNEFDGNNMDHITEIISVGDLSTHTLTIEESISHNTSEFQQGEGVNYVTISGISVTQSKIKFNAYYLMNSFKAGQSINIVLTVGGNNTTITRTISSVDYQNFALIVPAIGSAFNQLYGNIGVGVNRQMHIYTTSMHNNLTLNVALNNRQYPYLNNKIASLNLGDISFTSQNRKSLIDESVTRLHLPVNLNTMSVGDVENMSLVSFGSGIGKVEATIERLTDVNSYTRKWEIVINLTNCAYLLDEGLEGDTQIYFDNSLIIYTDMEWYVTNFINPYPTLGIETPFVLQHDLTNIRFLDDPFGNPTYSQIYPVAPSYNIGIYYNEESDIFEADFANFLSYQDLYIGASYVPSLDSYYKNKNEYQVNLSMLLTSSLASVGTYSSELNPDGAGYDLEIISLTNPYVSTLEIKFKIIPNTEFNTLLSQESFNKNFIVWAKFGHTCHTIYRGEALRKPKALIPFNDLKITPTNWCTIAGDKITDVLQVDDSYDTTALTPLSYPLFNTEDHLYLRYNLEVPLFNRYYNVKTELIFGLFTDILNTYVVLDNFQITSEFPYNTLNGKTNFDASVTNPYNIESSSFKNGLTTSSKGLSTPSTGNQLLTIFSMFQINWRYWLTQTGLYDFLIAEGLTTKDFISYIKDPLNARINNFYFFFVRTSFEDDDNIYYHFTQIWDILNYDEQFTSSPPLLDDEWQGSGVIKYYAENGLEVPNLIINELMKVEVIVTTGQDATTDSWGNITIEQFEQNQRWMMSSNYNRENNTNNPILPIVGQTKLKKEITDTNEITYSCLIDCNLLADNQDFKITLKHYNKDLKTEQTRFKFETRTSVLESDITNQFNLDSFDDCTDYFDVYGYDADPNDIEKNDTTLVLGYKNYDSTVVTFKIVNQDDENIGYSFTIATSPNDTKVKYSLIPWQSILNTYGIGVYRVYVVYTNGIDVAELLYGTYNLRYWSLNMLFGSVKIRSYINSIINTNKVSLNPNYYIDLNFNESKIIWDDVRVKGFFGNRQPKTVVENIISSGNNILASYKENMNEYTFSSVPLLTNHSNYLVDFAFLNGLYYEVWDYNKFNHNLYSRKKLTLKEVLDITPKGEHTNKAEIQAVFNDYYQANKMTY